MYKFYISLIFVLGIIGSCLATIPEPNKTGNDSISIDSVVGVYDGIFSRPIYLFIKPDSTYILTEACGLMIEGDWDIKGDSITLTARYDILPKGKKSLIYPDSTAITIVSPYLIIDDRLIAMIGGYDYKKITDKDRLDLILESQQRCYSFPLDTLIGNLW